MRRTINWSLKSLLFNEVEVTNVLGMNGRKALHRTANELIYVCDMRSCSFRISFITVFAVPSLPGRITLADRLMVSAKKEDRIACALQRHFTVESAPVSGGLILICRL